MKNFIQPGECVTFTAPAGGVVSGQGYQIGQTFVVACATVAEGLPFVGCAEGIVELPKTAAQAWAEGALIYWDAAGHECTTVAAGKLLIGSAAAVAANPSALGQVRLNGIAQANAGA